MPEPITNRYDFVYFFDITDGNPNGDPDAGNLPRLDPETGQGLVTDVCLKRKVRNYVDITKANQPGYDIFVREKAILNQQIERAYEQSGDVKAALAEWADYEKKKKARKGKREGEKITPPVRHFEDVARHWMCEQFFDVRTFGAVMSTGKEGDSTDGESKIRRTAGQVRGPMQLGIARSLHPILSQEFSITRCAVTTEREAEEQSGGNRTMGRKFTVPYALYRVHGFISPSLAGGDKGTGFSESDLDLFKKALDMMFEQDKSAARANMKPVACIAFRHESPLGDARADKLFERVRCTPKPGVQPLPGEPSNGDSELRPPRAFKDYELVVDEANLPKGVTVEPWVEWR